MSSTQNVASPRPRNKHQHSRSGGQPLPPNNNGKQSQRRKGNRGNNGVPAVGQNNSTGQMLDVQEPAFTDSAVVSSEDVGVSVGPRNPKKHTHSQPAADRIFSPIGVANSSLTDTELSHAYNASTPAKTQAAYAGPTFHASPAPSTLPIPKFLSKSVPAKTRGGPPTPPPDEEGSDSSSPIPSPSRAPVQIPSRHQDSPLDMLFKADRAERARNTGGSPATNTFSSPNQAPGNVRPHHMKHGSYGSLNRTFTIELDGDNKAPRASPPVSSPAVHRSVTAPSNIPQAQGIATPNDKNGAIHDLLNRLSISQRNSVESTPPKTADHVPSDPSLRTQVSPFNNVHSPFRSSPGPTTPVPPPQTNPDFFYGNRNLSPLFKAASKNPDDVNRNSGLRTEITADSPMMPQGAFPLMPPVNVGTNGMPPCAMVGNAMNGAVSPRRGSAPHVQPTQPYRGSPQHHRRGSGRRSYQPRPEIFSHANTNKPTNDATNAVSVPSSKTSNMMAFVPSSVRAKPKLQAQDTIPSKMASPSPANNNLALEQDLKRMLNLGMAGSSQ